MPKLSTSLKALSWAAYLACSWTWCIGMFLPILLLRDYGPWGFVVFAVPNVIGAAAMGFVLTRDQSRRIVATHRPMIVLFSLVTVAFHVFFLAWMEVPVPTLETLQLPEPLHWPAFLTISAGVAAGLSVRKQWPIASAVLLIFSISVLGILITNGFAPDLHPLGPQRASPTALIPLALPMIFGFLLCPYLDPTFHRALGESPSRRASFAIGFMAMFLTMIFLTTAYASLFLTNGRFGLGSLVFLHIFIQSALTVALHVDRVISLIRMRSDIVLLGIIGLLAVFILGRTIGYEPGYDIPAAFAGSSMSNAETTYRIFLSAYALVFPAYVYLCMIPTRDKHAGLSGPIGRRKRNTWLASVAIAAPFFWMGFIERRELFLIPGLAIILLARLTLPPARRRT